MGASFSSVGASPGSGFDPATCLSMVPTDLLPPSAQHTVSQLGNVAQLYTALCQYDDDSRPYSCNLLVLLFVVRTAQINQRLGAFHIRMEVNLQNVSSLEKRMATFCANIYPASLATTPQAICDIMGLNPEDIISTHFEDDDISHCPKFLVFVDHESANIVLLIRGTWSFKDVVADVVCEEIDFLDGFAHEAFVHAARNILRKSERCLAETLRSHLGYNLLVCGHSMGGGTGELLTMELLLGGTRNTLPPGIRVDCLALGAPPVFRPKPNKPLTPIVRQRIRMLMVANDPVPSLSLGSVAKLLKVIRAVDQGIQPNFSMLLTLCTEPNHEITGRTINILHSISQDRFNYLEHPGDVMEIHTSTDGSVMLRQVLDTQSVAENLALHENMVHSHLHTTYSKLLNNP